MNYSKSFESNLKSLEVTQNPLNSIKDNIFLSFFGKCNNFFSQTFLSHFSQCVRMNHSRHKNCKNTSARKRHNFKGKG